MVLVHFSESRPEERATEGKQGQEVKTDFWFDDASIEGIYGSHPKLKTSVDITLSELELESFFPADTAKAHILRRLAMISLPDATGGLGLLCTARTTPQDELAATRKLGHGHGRGERK